MKGKKPLKDGRYLARCKQATFIAAAAAGHSSVFPAAELVIAGGWAHFYRDGREVWSCNPSYAAANFEIERIVSTD